MASLHVGLSGFSYKEWQGEDLFYPPELKQPEYFAYYASRFHALEADGTWYHMPTTNGVQVWIDSTTPDFKVSPKMHRKVTHYARLKEDSIDALKFFVKRLEPLENAGRLGAILVQLPPKLGRDDDRLARFLAEIPHRPTLPWAIEFRNETWECPEIESLLREHNVSWVGMDTDDRAAVRRDTADHIYIRLRRSEYSDDRLREWAGYFRSKLEAGKDCYVYCKHEDAERPWIWADKLTEMIGWK
ncbi:MAG: hypothetical protein HONBIEJF_01746 [Fimbriimonadaceae bacterium]|nr:hypothetical protein [Fimbriimonadaceae bacterium]